MTGEMSPMHGQDSCHLPLNHVSGGLIISCHPIYFPIFLGEEPQKNYDRTFSDWVWPSGDVRGKPVSLPGGLILSLCEISQKIACMH